MKAQTRTVFNCVMALLLSVTITSGLTAIAVYTGFISLRMGLEVMLTFIVFLVAIASLIPIYDDFKALIHKEQKLKKSLIKKIQGQYLHLPRKKIIQSYIDEALYQHSRVQKRIEMLSKLQKDRQALDHFIDRIYEDYSDQEVMEDLGLRWTPKSSNQSKPHLRA